MNYSSNIIISDDRIQALYASQLYGTFFAVFANFEVSPTEEINQVKTKYIKNIKFSLINYKGNLNLEIVGSGNVRQTKIEGLPGFTVDLYIKHTSHSKPMQIYDQEEKSDVLELDLTDPKNFEIKEENNSSKSVHTENGVKVTSGFDYLRLERKLISMNKEPNKDIPEAIVASSTNNGVFDSEFYERDGNYVVLKKPIDFTNPNGVPMYNKGILNHPSASCPPSNSKIYFD